MAQFLQYMRWVVWIFFGRIYADVYNISGIWIVSISVLSSVTISQPLLVINFRTSVALGRYMTLPM
jgi:hypothetical protein